MLKNLETKKILLNVKKFDNTLITVFSVDIENRKDTIRLIAAKI